MKTAKRKEMSTQRLVIVALFTAIVAILSYFGGFIKIGGLASISLTLIPVVLGGAIYGPAVGAFLGGVSGAVFFLTPDAAFWLGLSIPGTVITVMVKGILAGLSAGLVYKLFVKVNRYVSVMVAAIVCPVVNTGIFLLGCLIFFLDTVNADAVANGMSVASYLIIFFVGLNFVFELAVNVILSPAIVRIIDIAEKKFPRKG